MTDIPSAGYFTTVGRTNLEAKTAQDQMLAVLRETLGGSAISTLTIAAGSVTPTGALHQVDTEAAAATDDLATVQTTNHPEGRVIRLRSTDNSRTVVVKHGAGGAGQILLSDGADLTLSDTTMWLELIRVGTGWVELGRFHGANKNAARAFIGLSNHGQCRLTFVDSNTIKLVPFNGNKLVINGNVETIPAAGVSVGCTSANGSTIDGVSANLVVNTTYRVYAYMSAGVMKLDFSTTGYSTDATTGVAVKTGDATRTLVGMVRTDGTPSFALNAAATLVISYFNRRSIHASTISAPTGIGASFVERTSSSRVQILKWDDEAIELGCTGFMASDTLSIVQGQIQLDSSGATALQTVAVTGGAGTDQNMSEWGALDKIDGVAEGYHYATWFASNSAGTASAQIKIEAVIRG